VPTKRTPNRKPRYGYSRTDYSGAIRILNLAKNIQCEAGSIAISAFFNLASLLVTDLKFYEVVQDSPESTLFQLPAVKAFGKNYPFSQIQQLGRRWNYITFLQLVMFMPRASIIVQKLLQAPLP